MKTPKRLKITEKDFMLANRKAAREEEIRLHGRQILFRAVRHRSKKVYDRNRLKKVTPEDAIGTTGNFKAAGQAPDGAKGRGCRGARGKR